MSGSSFRGGSLYLCRFGSSEVAASHDAEHDEVRCISPAAVAGVAALAVSLNGQQFTRDTAPFEFYVAPVVSHLLPATGPIGGGTSVIVFGSGFSHGKDYRCRFGSGAESTVVVASMESDSRLACSAPAPRCGPGACEEVLEVSSAEVAPLMPAAPGTVVVRVAAAALNPVDFKMRRNEQPECAPAWSTAAQRTVHY